MVAVVQPRSVIRGKDHERLAIESMPGERRQDLSDRPVDFFHHVAIHAGGRLALELVADVQRNMGHALRHVQQEGLILVAIDKTNRVLGVPGR